MNILERYDKNYKIGRAKLIAENYDSIVALALHDILESSILSKFNLSNIKEIVKFDYRTNENNMGDEHIWIEYADTNNKNIKLYIELNTNDDGFKSNMKNKLIINDIAILLSLENFDLDEFYDCLHKLLKVFHRGYDKLISV
jgi:hypothetical protein